MHPPVNLTELRTMTDGDADMEKELFSVFYDSFESGLSLLHENRQESRAQSWYQHAHALKGIALNLGAETLGDLCKTAQEIHAEPEAVKAPLLAHIQAEYGRVKQYLQQLA